MSFLSIRRERDKSYSVLSGNFWEMHWILDYLEHTLIPLKTTNMFSCALSLWTLIGRNIEEKIQSEALCSCLKIINLNSLWEKWYTSADFQNCKATYNIWGFHFDWKLKIFFISTCQCQYNETGWHRGHSLPALSNMWQHIKLSDALSWDPSAI